MPVVLKSEQVWREVERQLFAVLGVVTPAGEPRTVGICYVVRDRQLYIVTGRETWKARHIEKNPRVSLTVMVAKRIPFLPWIPIPAATVSFQGEATIHSPSEVAPEILRRLTRGAEFSPEVASQICVVKVQPSGEFLTYGIGVPLLAMRKPEKARGRAPV
jgi:hypothetical protein